METAEAVRVRATEETPPARRTAIVSKAPTRTGAQAHSARATRLPVRSLLLPRRHRAVFIALAAFYRETRTLGTPSKEHRARLDRWEAEIERVWGGGTTADAVLAPLAARGLPKQPLLDLLAAQRLRHNTTTFPTYDALLHYCALAANPVGRLSLAILGRDDDERLEYSDAICTALQLTAFWRDVVRDFARGRVYFPEEDLHLFGVTADDLAHAIAIRRADTNIRALVAFETERALELFHYGSALVSLLRGRARLDCALLISDGRAMLSAIARHGYDPIVARPQLSRTAKAGTILGAFRSMSSETLRIR
jgi:squalene synthase HpnC